MRIRYIPRQSMENHVSWWVGGRQHCEVGPNWINENWREFYLGGQLIVRFEGDKEV